MSRKKPSFGQLLAYMTNPERIGPAICHNLAMEVEKNIAAIYRDFLDNFRYLPHRKNGNVLYHEVLSFGDQDRSNITPSILEDLTRKYLELRAPFALAYAQAHLDTDCPHVHIMISANNRQSSRRVSLSRKEFSKVKRDLEQYQKIRYPFLAHSVVFKREQAKRKRQAPIRHRRNESERERRLAKQDHLEPSEKEQIRQLVAEQIATAKSGKALYLRLKNLGLLLYKRGKHVAVQDLVGRGGSFRKKSGRGRRYRLMTLGLADEFRKAQRQWNGMRQTPEHLLEPGQLEREQQLWLKQGYRDEIRDVLALRSTELSPLERERLEQIHSLRAAQRRSELKPPDISL